MTNKSTYKNVAWDADFYNSLTDDECIVCLTERQIYLIGAIIGVIRWTTRWIGNITGMDLDAIQSDLEYRISERMTCTSVSDILNKITSLEQQINITQQQIDAANGGEPLPTPDTSYDTAFDTPEKLSDATWATDGCDDTDKNEWWGGITELVRYINQTNVDALQNISQAGNAASQAQRLISGIPVVGQLPIDEVVGWASFLADELLDEYEATVDEELLEQTQCDLFCLAVSNGCSLSMRDVLDYFGDKIAGNGSFAGILDDLANAAQFALIGSFSGDDYFYYMCFLQLLAATITNGFFGFRPIDYYSIRVETGMNNPDSDWELLCLSCPTYYRVLTHDFRYDGAGDWTIALGDLTGDGVTAEPTSGTNRASEILRTVDPDWQFIGMRSYYDRDPNSGNLTWNLRVTEGTNTGGIQPTTSNCDELGQFCSCTDDFGTPDWRDGFVQLRHVLQVGGVTTGTEAHIQRVRLWFTVDNAPDAAHITSQSPYC